MVLQPKEQDKNGEFNLSFKNRWVNHFFTSVGIDFSDSADKLLDKPLLKKVAEESIENNVSVQSFSKILNS